MVSDKNIKPKFRQKACRIQSYCPACGMAASEKGACRTTRESFIITANNNRIYVDRHVLKCGCSPGVQQIPRIEIIWE